MVSLLTEQRARQDTPRVPPTPVFHLNQNNKILIKNIYHKHLADISFHQNIAGVCVVP